MAPPQVRRSRPPNRTIRALVPMLVATSVGRCGTDLNTPEPCPAIPYTSQVVSWFAASRGSSWCRPTESEESACLQLSLELGAEVDAALSRSAPPTAAEVTSLAAGCFERNARGALGTWRVHNLKYIGAVVATSYRRGQASCEVSGTLAAPYGVIGLLPEQLDECGRSLEPVLWFDWGPASRINGGTSSLFERIRRAAPAPSGVLWYDLRCGALRLDCAHDSYLPDCPAEAPCSTCGPVWHSVSTAIADVGARSPMTRDVWVLWTAATSSAPGPVASPAFTACAGGSCVGLTPDIEGQRRVEMMAKDLGIHLHFLVDGPRNSTDLPPEIIGLAARTGGSIAFPYIHELASNAVLEGIVEASYRSEYPINLGGAFESQVLGSSPAVIQFRIERGAQYVMPCDHGIVMGSVRIGVSESSTVEAWFFVPFCGGRLGVDC